MPVQAELLLWTYTLDKFKVFFDMPVDNLFTTPLFAKYIKKKFKSKNLICVSPDVGGVQRTRGLATRIKADLAIIDKRDRNQVSLK